MNQTQSYEAYCPSCRVSHTPGTRRCLHCGGEVMKSRPEDVGSMQDDGIPDVRDFLRPDEGPVESSDGQPASRKPAPGGARVAISLLWVALAIGISVYRGCQGG